MSDVQNGSIIQVNGPVVDVQFHGVALPNINEALEVENNDGVLVFGSTSTTR